MPTNLVPASLFSTESWAKNSRFISHIGPAFTVESAREFIARITREHTDASHNVPVYIIGFGASTVEHASDDGEPSGTAGRPALSVLKGSGLGDTVLVITRYFGGTKLGTGGLVKAYGDAARSAVEGVPKAAKVDAVRLKVTCQYSLYEQIARLIAQSRGFSTEEQFTDQVSVEFSLPSATLEGFQAAATNLSSGSAVLEILQENLIALQPLSKGNH